MLRKYNYFFFVKSFFHENFRKVIGFHEKYNLNTNLFLDG